MSPRDKRLLIISRPVLPFAPNTVTRIGSCRRVGRWEGCRGTTKEGEVQVIAVVGESEW